MKHFVGFGTKELSLFAANSDFSNQYIFKTQCRPLMFKTINPVISNSLSVKYQRFTPSVCDKNSNPDFLTTKISALFLPLNTDDNLICL